MTSIINGTARVLRGRDDKENVVPDCDVIDKDGLTPTELLEGIRNNPAFRDELRAMDIKEEDMGVVFKILDNDGSGDVNYRSPF